MLNFMKTKHRDIGVIIENRKLNNLTNQILIKVEDFKYISDAGDTYLITFLGVGHLREGYYTSKLQNIPDENNILAFSFRSSDISNSIIPGMRIKIRGPFKRVM